MREKPPITVNKTGVMRYYAVNPGCIEDPVTDMYDANVDDTERTVLELETQSEPTAESRDIISKGIAAFKAD